MFFEQYLYMVFTTEGFFEVAIESWPKWDLNARPQNSVYKFTNKCHSQTTSSLEWR